MFIELSLLPPAVQEQILTVQEGNTVAFTQNGQVIATVNQAVQQPSYANGDFDYDLERMKYMMDTKFIRVPYFDTPEELLEWTERLSDADFEKEQA